MSECKAKQWCDKITNDNTRGMCQHQYCSQKYTHWTQIEIYGMPICICFCEKHANEYDEHIWQNREVK
jgi:hypothetical protein